MALPSGAGRGSIRVRTTAIAVTVVGIALVVAAVTTVIVIRRSMTDQVRTGALARAHDIAAERDATTSPLVAGGDREHEFVQIVDPSGAVVASSPNVEGRPRLFDVPPGHTRTVVRVPSLEGPFVVVAVHDGPDAVIVGRTLDDARDTWNEIAFAFVIAVPLLLFVVGAVTWRIVGRALAPVDAMRREVDSITAGELDRRLPDPSGADEIARLAGTMNRMLDRLEADQARQHRFVSDASHELRSPVAAIRQHAELALRYPDQTDLPTLAGVAHEESIRLQRIVEDLLLLSRIDEGSLAMRHEPVDLDDLVQDEAARLRARPSLQVMTDRIDPARVEGDRSRLERLVRNLGENAARHARAAVALELRRDDGAAILSIEDDGAGIPAAERERVFDRFVRLDEARERDAGGSGLGLSIGRELASLHGGVVSVADGRLGGARFEVRLPVASS